MVSAEFRVTVGFMVVGLLAWWATAQLTDSFVLQFAVLVGIGVVAPTIINERR